MQIKGPLELFKTNTNKHENENENRLFGMAAMHAGFT